MSHEAGRKRIRVCECGEELPPDGKVCPVCGVKWAGKIKVKIRKRKRSHRSEEAEAGREKTRTGVLAAVLVICLGLLVAALCALWPHVDALLETQRQANLP